MQSVQVLDAHDIKFTPLDEDEPFFSPGPWTMSFEIPYPSPEMIALMTGQPLELCRVCGNLVKMQVFKNTGVCCGNCQKADERRQAKCICSPMHRTKMARYKQDHTKRCKAAA